MTTEWMWADEFVAKVSRLGTGAEKRPSYEWFRWGGESALAFAQKDAALGAFVRSQIASLPWSQNIDDDNAACIDAIRERIAQEKP